MTDRDTGLRLQRLHQTIAALSSVQLELNEERLHRRRESVLFDRILESMADAVVVVNMRGRVWRTNQAALRLTGRSAEEAVGLTVNELLGSRVPNTAWEIIQREREGSPTSFETVVASLDGRSIPVSLSCALIRERGGKITGTIYVARDLTQIHELFDELERAYERERDIAQTLQRTFLPDSLPQPPGWELRVHYQPSRVVGGDFYDALVLPDGRLGIALGDVAGKGVRAALLMATARGVLREAALAGPGGPAVLLTATNRILFSEFPPKMFTTCVYAEIDPRSGRMRYANAGHHPPLILRGDREMTELESTGIPLGLDEAASYDEQERLIPPGGQLFLYSDGLTDARGRTGARFDTQGLKEALSTASGEETIETVLDRLHDFVGANWERQDDLTILTLRRSAEGGAAPSQERWRHEGRLASSLAQPVVEAHLPADKGAPARARALVTSLEGLVSREHLPTIKLAVSELVTNAVLYGPAGPAEVIDLSIEVLHDRLRIDVSDGGRGFGLPLPGSPHGGLQKGLELVEAVSRAWGIQEEDRFHVWCEIATPPS